MLFALTIAALTAAIVASAVVVLNAARSRARLADLELQRRITEHARSTGGVVTPRSVARALGTTPLEAERLLRAMVDDVFLKMELDPRGGELRFVFSQLASDEGEEARARRRS
ncbi:hypothetical protein L6R52_43050, partial [Myxococcota bacterium]|nr:hypothetical protein [Myxococcota bacterium]